MFFKHTNKTSEESLAMLESSLRGLSEKEALLRLKKYGPNEIKIEQINVWKIIARQLRSPFVYMLFFASLISLFIGEHFDFLVIIFIVIANLFIGFFHEYRAEKAVFVLKKFIFQRVKILRGGKEIIINKSDLVPGDIIFLNAGDAVPADIRIIKIHNFSVDESALSGESLPVYKDPAQLAKEEKEIFESKNIAFSGTTVVSGRAEGVVVATGKETFLGKIAENVSKEEYKPSSYEKDIFYFSRLVLKIVSSTVILILVLGTAIKGRDSFFNSLLFSVALIVGILPEGLPTVVSFALARGSAKMAKRNVVVRRLSAIERLGNIDVLCTDKTGTLTKNKMSLEKIVSSDREKCLLYGVLSSNPENIQNKILNPFDEAILQKISPKNLKNLKKFEIISELPFDSFRMKSAFLAEELKGDKILIVKGAAESILESCSKLKSAEKKEIKENTAKEGKEGKRVLAVAYKKVPKNKLEITIDDEKGLTFLGYFVFEDPIKETAAEALKEAKNLGVSIKVITGDSKEVATYLAKKIKLVKDEREVLSGKELEKLPSDEFVFACEETNVFARISPEMKYKIVKALQKRHDVGFLGDGINDAPALRMADVGIAVEESTDVSRDVSDVVLLKRDLRVIVEGIRDGRNIFANINKYIKAMIASNFGNFYSIATIFLFVDFLPMLPIQILLSNLLSDLPLISIVTDKVDKDELSKPKGYHLRNVLSLVISLAIIITLFDFIFYSIFRNEVPKVIQTLWFIESTICELLLVIIIRTKRVFWKGEKLGKSLFVAIVGVFVISIILPYTEFGKNVLHFASPSIYNLLKLSGLLLVFVVVSEIVKWFYFKRFHKKQFLAN